MMTNMFWRLWLCVIFYFEACSNRYLWSWIQRYDLAMSDLDAKTLILGESDDDQWYASDPLDDEHDGNGKKDAMECARHEPDQQCLHSAPDAQPHGNQPDGNGEKDRMDRARHDPGQHVQGDPSNAQPGGNGEKEPKDSDPENEDESTDSEVGGFGFMTLDGNMNVITHGTKMSSYSYQIMERIQGMLANGDGNGASSSSGPMPVADGHVSSSNPGTRKMRRKKGGK